MFLNLDSQAIRIYFASIIFPLIIIILIVAALYLKDRNKRL
jgi:heme/copper-type cytochrome/quinol oxidase subunit 4